MRPPISLHESTVEKFYQRIGGEIVADSELATMAKAMRDARTDTERLCDLSDALVADRTRTPQAAALHLRKEALKAGERAGAKLDAARQRTVKVLDALRTSTAAPPAPKDALDLQIETEIRSKLANMPRADRVALIGAAFKADDEATLGAYLRGPAFLSGATDTEREFHRDAWRRKRFPSELDREARLQKATDALDRGGGALVKLISGIVNAPAATEADAATKRVTAAEATTTE